MQDHDQRVDCGQTSFGKDWSGIIPLEFGAGLTLTSAKYFTPSGRLIQRDYSNGGFYDYYTHGAGMGRDPEQASRQKPSGPERRTRAAPFTVAAASCLTKRRERANSESDAAADAQPDLFFRSRTGKRARRWIGVSRIWVRIVFDHDFQA